MTETVLHPPVGEEPGNPFRGPQPLAVGDPIFGRTREIDALLAQLVANRVVLLHSVSGCGKTSLIDAGLRPRLHEYRLRGLPTIRLPRRTAAPGADVASLLQPVNDVLTARLLEAPPLTVDGPKPPRATFDVLIFDQFEEVLDASRVSEAERVEFFKKVGGILTDRTIWALFAMREDYLGTLDPYLRFLPNYLESRFRITQLALKDAEDAIVSICEKSGVTFQPAAATRLAADLATVGDVADTTRGPDGRLVEPVYLQIAGRYLWDLARAANRREITSEDVKASVVAAAPHSSAQPLAPVEIALQRYYDLAIAQATGDTVIDSTQPLDAIGVPSSPARELQERVRKWFSDELITYTPQGELRKQTLFLPESTPIDAGTLHKLENTYIIRKDVRNGTWYELAHDRLVKPVLRSNLAVRRRSLQPWQEAAEAWSQEGESRALLVLRGAALDDALRWAAKNSKRVTETERRFLDQCKDEVHQRRKLKRNRNGAIVVAVGGVIVAVGAFAFAASNAARAAVSQRAAAENERLMVENLQHARTLERSAREAQRQLTEANDRMRESVRQTQVSKETADEAVAQARVARAQAAGARADAVVAQAQAITARNEATQSRNESEAVLSRSAAEVTAARGEIATSSAIVEAYDSLSHAQRGAVLEEALSAAQKLTRQFGTVWTDRGRQALTQSLETIEHLYSRNLVAASSTTTTPVLGVGLNPKTNCVQYLGETGSFAALNVDTGRPCETPPGKPAQAGQLKFVTSQALSEDASVTATGSAKGQIGLIRTSDPQPRDPFQGYRHEVMTAYVSPTGRYLATASSLWSFEVADLKRWPAEDSDPKRLMRRPRAGVRGWFHWFKFFRGETTHIIDAFTIDEEGATIGGQGPVVATARRDGAVEFFDVVRQARLLKLPGPIERLPGIAGHDKAPAAIAFDRSGLTLASGGAGGEVLVWQLPPNLAAWKELDAARKVPPVVNLRGCKDGILDGSSAGGVTAIAFSPDDRVLAVGCQTGVVWLYYLPDNFPAESVEPPEPLLTLVGQPSAMVFSKTSRRLIVGGSAARLEHWIVPTEVQMKARQSVLKRIVAARERVATTATAIDPAGISATLAAIGTAAPQTTDTWGRPRPHGPKYMK